MNVFCLLLSHLLPCSLHFTQHLLLLFFCSGVCGLIYQVLWLRLLALVFGVTVYAASTVLAAFMAGLGVGSLGGGYIADRISRRSSLILFGLAELAVAGFGTVSATIYYDVLYLKASWLYADLWRAGYYRFYDHIVSKERYDELETRLLSAFIDDLAERWRKPSIPSSPAARWTSDITAAASAARSKRGKAQTETL